MLHRSMPAFGPIVSLVFLFLSGCTEPFQGSNILLSLYHVPPPCDALSQLIKSPDSNVASISTDEFKKCNGIDEDDRLRFYYQLWSVTSNSVITPLKAFTIQKYIFPNEQFYFESIGAKTAEGFSFKIGTREYLYEMNQEEQQLNIDEMNRIYNMNIFVVTSYSSTKFSSDPERTNTLSKNLYVGNHRVIALPHNGIYYGQVDGSSPIGTPTLHGGYFIDIQPKLVDLNSLFITIESFLPENEIKQPSALIYLLGSDPVNIARHSVSLNLANLYNPDIRGEFSIISSLEEEEYF